jgi:hypothetical protein
MKSVSSAFASAIKGIVRTLRAKVDVLWTDPFVSSGNYADALDTNYISWHDPHLVDTRITTPHKYLLLDGTATLDGTFYAAPCTQAEQQNNQFGWYSREVCSAGGYFENPPEATVYFGQSRAVRQFKVVGEPTLNQWPVDFDIYIYDSSHTELFYDQYTGIAPVTEIDITDEGINNAKSIRIVVLRWSTGNTVSKIIELFGVITDSFSENDIVSLDLTEEREIKDATLPIGNISSNEIDISFQNIKIVRSSTGEVVRDPFFPDNSNSYIAASITPNVRFVVSIGAVLPGGATEYVEIGTFWSRDWVIDDDAADARVTARDRLDLLKDVDFRLDEILVNKTLYEIAETLLSNAKENIPMGDLEWDIDTELQNFTVPYAWFGRMNYLEALTKIAEACLGQCYMSKDDVLIIESYKKNEGGASNLSILRSEYFKRSQPINSSDLKNVVEIQISPLGLAEESADIKTSDTISFQSGVDNILDYKIEWEDDAYDEIQAEITDEDGVTVSFLTEPSYYPWGCILSIHKESGDSGTFAVAISGKRLENITPVKYSRQDDNSILLYGKREYVYKLNFLIQDELIAETIAIKLLNTYANPRKDVVIDWIGNPALELGDVVHVPVYTNNQTKASVYADFVVYKNRLSFDEGLRSTTEGRAFITFTEVGARAVGSGWFDSTQTFDDFITPTVNAYYSVDGGADVLIETIYLEAYQESSGGATVTLYRGEFNGTIPPGAVGSTVVKIYNPSYPDDYLEYDAIDVV